MTASRTVFVILVLLAGCKKEEKKPEARQVPTDGKVSIQVTKKGFEPANIQVVKGEPVTFVFMRTTDDTCAKEVLIHVDEGQTIEKALPLDEPVEIAVTFPKSGTIKYACGMDMVKGEILVE